MWLIEQENPDIVIIATGFEPLIPNISRIENAITVDDFLLGKKETENDVIDIGAGLAGCETALHLAKQGKKVTVVEARPEVAADMKMTSKIFFTDSSKWLFKNMKSRS